MRANSAPKTSRQSLCRHQQASQGTLPNQESVALSRTRTHYQACSYLRLSALQRPEIAIIDDEFPSCPPFWLPGPPFLPLFLPVLLAHRFELLPNHQLATAVAA